MLVIVIFLPVAALVPLPVKGASLCPTTPLPRSLCAGTSPLVNSSLSRCAAPFSQQHDECVLRRCPPSTARGWRCACSLRRLLPCLPANLCDLRYSRRCVCARKSAADRLCRRPGLRGHPCASSLPACRAHGSGFTTAPGGCQAAPHSSFASLFLFVALMTRALRESSSIRLSPPLLEPNAKTSSPSPPPLSGCSPSRLS